MSAAEGVLVLQCADTVTGPVMSSLPVLHGSVTSSDHAAPMQLTWTRRTDDGGRPSSVLEVEAQPGDGELEALWRALFACRVHVTAVRVQVQGNRLVEQLETCEPDGAPLSAEREGRVRAALAASVEGVDETVRRSHRVRPGRRPPPGKLEPETVWRADE